MTTQSPKGTPHQAVEGRSAARRYVAPSADATGPPSDRVRVRRDTNRRGRYDVEAVHQIVDATPFCHLAYIHDGHPVVIPTLQVRIGDSLYLHASSGSRIGLQASVPWPVSVSVTLIDGLVMARSGFHHSVNYRSVVVIGEALLVTDPDEKIRALDATVDHVAPGRTGEVRRPNARELQATAVARLSLAEASVKARTGPPNDEPEDMNSPVWAGVVPMGTVFGTPIPSPDLVGDMPIPPSIVGLRQTADGARTAE